MILGLQILFVYTLLSPNREPKQLTTLFSVPQIYLHKNNLMK